MANLPDDMVVTILSKLPVKSLLRFKCVSKLWHSWISDPKFKRQGSESSSIALVRSIYQRSFCLITTQRNEPLFVPFSTMSLNTGNDFNLLGSCDGLLLINHGKHIFLWNPATRFYNKVLERDELSDYTENLVYGGLCFDPSTNDYKALLCINYQIAKNVFPEYVVVASLKDKVWKEVDCSFSVDYMGEGVALHGRVHYCVRFCGDKEDCFNKKLAYFDPVSDKFHMFPVPEPKRDQKEKGIHGLGVINECLCVACSEDEKSIEIFVMKKYGVKESWTCLFVIKNRVSPDYVFPLVKPLFATENGETTFLVNECEIVVCNPKRGSIRQCRRLAGQQGINYCIFAFTYVESLITPKEYNV